MSNVVVFDIESTGLDFWRNEILTISASIMDGLKVVDEFEGKFRPIDFQTWSSEAEQVHKISVPDAMAFNDQKEETIRFGKFISQVKKQSDFVCHAINYRGSYFDTGFLQAHFTKHGLLYNYRKYFKSTLSTIDLMRKYSGELGYPDKSYKLDRVCSFLGIPLDHHNAQSDRKACEQIYKTCMEIECRR